MKYFFEELEPVTLTPSQYQVVIEEVCGGGLNCIDKIVAFVDPKEIFEAHKKVQEKDQP